MIKVLFAAALAALLSLPGIQPAAAMSGIISQAPYEEIRTDNMTLSGGERAIFMSAALQCNPAQGYSGCALRITVKGKFSLVSPQEKATVYVRVDEREDVFTPEAHFQTLAKDSNSIDVPISGEGEWVTIRLPFGLHRILVTASIIDRESSDVGQGMKGRRTLEIEIIHVH